MTTMTTKFLNALELDAILDTLIGSFPAEFGLRAFPGETFRISRSASYFPKYRYETTERVEPQLYTQRLSESGEWLDFSKGTAVELRREVCSTPAQLAAARDAIENEIADLNHSAEPWTQADLKRVETLSAQLVAGSVTAAKRAAADSEATAKRLESSDVVGGDIMASWIRNSKPQRLKRTTKRKSTKLVLDAAQSKLLKRGLAQVWGEIGWDCGEVESNEQALELCIDADRMSRIDAEAHALVSLLVELHGYPVVLKTLSKLVVLV